jgi:hypothetical protein
MVHDRTVREAAVPERTHAEENQIKTRAAERGFSTFHFLMITQRHNGISEKKSPTISAREYLVYIVNTTAPPWCVGFHFYVTLFVGSIL